MMSCITSPESVKPKMAVMCANVPLMRALRASQVETGVGLAPSSEADGMP